jgi:predicted nucleotidyltransferase component of viral defense system
MGSALASRLTSSGCFGKGTREKDMNTSDEFFRTKLYPLQDGILAIVRKSGTPFYLTGGTALSRRWFHHRYSEDLDLFVDNDPGFGAYVDTLFACLKEAEGRGEIRVDSARARRSSAYVQLWLVRGESEPVDLKVDLVNDAAPRVGATEMDPVLGRVDGWRNILANKVAALSRYEPKDVADIWVIARNRSFSWREIVADAQSKEVGIDPVDLHEILRSVPEHELARVAWAITVDLSAVRDDLRRVAEDVLRGESNSLAPAVG